MILTEVPRKYTILKNCLKSFYLINIFNTNTRDNYLIDCVFLKFQWPFCKCWRFYQTIALLKLSAIEVIIYKSYISTISTKNYSQYNIERLECKLVSINWLEVYNSWYSMGHSKLSMISYFIIFKNVFCNVMLYKKEI